MEQEINTQSLVFASVCWVLLGDSGSCGCSGESIVSKDKASEI